MKLKELILPYLLWNNSICFFLCISCIKGCISLPFFRSKSYMCRAKHLKWSFPRNTISIDFTIVYKFYFIFKPKFVTVYFLYDSISYFLSPSVLFSVLYLFVSSLFFGRKVMGTYHVTVGHVSGFRSIWVGPKDSLSLTDPTNSSSNRYNKVVSYKV